MTAVDDDGNEYVTDDVTFQGDYAAFSNVDNPYILWNEELPAGHYTITIENINPNSYFVFQGPAAEEAYDTAKFNFDRQAFSITLMFVEPAPVYYLDNPVPVTPPTADASLVIFALAACAIALVVLKKKAF